jgi:Leu/Phe-tRNA-protein transferase
MAKDKSLRTFVRTFRKEISEHIRSVCPNCGRLNDEDREEWINNDESLYSWAKEWGWSG